MKEIIQDKVLAGEKREPEPIVEMEEVEELEEQANETE